jgi:hypothetical protein
LQSSGIPLLAYIGQSGSVAIGYSAPATVGAALANHKHGRISINFQHDGECPRHLSEPHADNYRTGESASFDW